MGSAVTVDGPARVRVGTGWAAYVGPSLGLDRHRGAVTCVGVGVDDVLRVEADDSGPVVGRTVLVPAGVRHRITTGAGRVAFVYLEPDRHATGGASGRRDGADAALVAAATTGDAAALHRAACRWTGVPRPAGPPDRRIAQALAALHRPGGADLPTSRLALACGLTPEHFLRLFARHVGVGLPAYRRWARMRTVAAVVQAGGNLTRAAADAGFATPSHLALTFRHMFGLAPGRLLGPDADVRVDASQPGAASTSPPLWDRAG